MVALKEEMEEKVEELQEVLVFLLLLSDGLKSGLSPEEAFRKATLSYKGPLEGTVTRIKDKMLTQTLPFSKAIKMLAKNVESVRIKVILQMLNLAVRKDSKRAGEMLEEVIQEEMEEIKTVRERIRQLKAQELKVKILVASASGVQGALAALLPYLKLALTGLATLGAYLPAPEQSWPIAAVLSISNTLAAYLIARSTTINPRSITLIPPVAIMAAFLLASTFLPPITSMQASTVIQLLLESL
nr:hypothetical protein [Candidatus Freyrarchaeum guaymaensis]